MEIGKEREAILAAVNPLLGRGVFVFLKVPGSWRVLSTSASPECNALGKEVVGERSRWITSGFMHALLVDDERKKAYPLFVEAREFVNDVKALEFIQKRLQKLANESETTERKPMRVGRHEAWYFVWTNRKRMFLKRKEVALAHLECAIYCDSTKRVLIFRISSSRVEDFMRDKEKMLSILSSIVCHS